MHGFRIFEVAAVGYRENELFKFLKSRADPETQRVRVRRAELSEAFQCDEMTISRIFNRLSEAGYIRRCELSPRFGVEFEVLCPPSSKTANT